MGKLLDNFEQYIESTTPEQRQADYKELEDWNRVGLNRYEFGYSQAESGIMVVYANTKEEAITYFEQGKYEIEDIDLE